ncbi:hypothetical protein AAVH_41372 [Aphelenchoides avenae]|nr:hypothetical protein AAVH_41372 [Aphelenchus avenae]
MTKDEHDRHAKKSGERRLRSTRALDAAEEIITRCRQELSAIRTDDARTSGAQQVVASNATRNQKRPAPSTGTAHAGPPRQVLKTVAARPKPPRAVLQTVAARPQLVADRSSDSEEFDEFNDEE